MLKFTVPSYLSRQNCSFIDMYHTRYSEKFIRRKCINAHFLQANLSHVATIMLVYFKKVIRKIDTGCALIFPLIAFTLYLVTLLRSSIGISKYSEEWQ